MAFLGNDGVDFDDFDAPYVSAFPNFGSSRRVRDSNNTIETRRTPAIPGKTKEVSNKKKSSRRVVNQNDSIVNVLSFFSILDSVTDFLALGVFISLDKRTESTVMIFGFIASTFLRSGAVWQYSRNTTIFMKLSNILFGSRFGWSEKYDRKLLAKASVGLQFGFPLILHSVSDLVQHGCSFYPLFVAITDGPNSLEGFDYAAITIAFITTVMAMIGTLLIRISYGARLVELSLLTTYSTIFLAFVLLQVTFEEFVEDKIYTREIVFPWIKFLTISTSAFTKTAMEVRSGTLINLPAFLTGTIFSIIVIDLVSLIFIRSDPAIFIDEDQDILDANITVDQVIYANLAYDVYVAMFMGIQYILITEGNLA